MCVPRLFRCFPFACLKECFLHVQMPAFDNLICLRVVHWDTDVAYSVYLHEVFRSSYKGSTIISDDFWNSSPTTQNLFINKLPNCFPSLRLHHTPLRPPRQGVSSMQYVMISSRLWHMFCVNMHFSEESRNIKNNWWDYYLLYAIQLTLVVGLYKPLNIRIYL